MNKTSTSNNPEKKLQYNPLESSLSNFKRAIKQTSKKFLDLALKQVEEEIEFLQNNNLVEVLDHVNFSWKINKITDRIKALTSKKTELINTLDKLKC